jgi:hypothetical protein
MTTRYITEYTVRTEWDVEMPTEETGFGPDWKRASRTLYERVALLTGSTEPVPCRTDHGPGQTTYTVDSREPHPVFGNWKVILTAYEIPDGEQCDTCGEWFVDEDAWGEHNDMEHY